MDAVDMDDIEKMKQLAPWNRRKVPQTLKVIKKNIPYELIESPRWVVWKAQLKEGGSGFDKPPYQARNPYAKASKNNPAHFSDFETAYECYLDNDDVAGIGYVVDKRQGIVWVDLDKCINNGEVSAEIQTIVNQFASYAEYSPSNNGIRILVRGGIPRSFNNTKIGREMYNGDKSSYLTITGQVLDDAISTIEDNQEALSHFFELWKSRKKANTDGTPINIDTSKMADSVDLGRLSSFTRSVIEGDYSSYVTPVSTGRSEALLGVAIDMIEAKYTDAEIIRVAVHPEYKIAEVANERRGGDTESAIEWFCKYTFTEAKRTHKKRHSPTISAILKHGTPTPEPEQKQTAPDLTACTVPGALNEFVEWYQQTAITPQPGLAVQAALALGSLVAGRQYMTDRLPNYSNLWFLNVAKSGAGKEHARWCIDKILAESGHNELMNNGYTSKGAVFSMLHVHPCHISIIDELGRYLEAAMQDRGHVHFKDGITALMESWNRSDGTLKPPQYSDKGLSDSVKAELRQPILKPSVTLLGMTTPSTLYASITKESVRDGFLSRFIMCESEIEGSDELRPVIHHKPPKKIVDWVKAAMSSKQAGNLMDAHLPGTAPPPHIVAIDDASWSIFQACKKQEGKARRKAEASELGELANRTTQKAIRIALILAVSVNHISPRITRDLAQWAVDYATRLDARMIKIAASRLVEGRLGKLNQRLLDYIKRGGARGRTDRDIKRSYGAHGNDFAMSLKHLMDAEHVKFIEIEHQGGRGRKRQAYVHEDYFGDLISSVNSD